MGVFDTKIIFISIIFLIISVIYFSFSSTKRNNTAGVAFLSLFTLFFLLSLFGTDSISKIGIGSVIIELNQKIDQAKDLINELDQQKKEMEKLANEQNIQSQEIKKSTNKLTELSKTSAKIMFETIQSQGRFDRPIGKKEYELFGDISNTLKKSGIPNKDIEKIQNENWHRWVYLDFCNKIFDQYPNMTENERLAVEEWNKKLEKGIQICSPTEAQVILVNHNALTSKRKKWIENYKYYIKNKKHKDLNDWINYHS